MAQIPYRANLSAAEFPFLIAQAGRTAIVKAYDQNYIPNVASQADKDKDQGVAQLYYCHNVLPTDTGVRSVGYADVVGAATAFNPAFENIYTLRDDSNNVAYLSTSPGGRCFIAASPDYQWLQSTTLANIDGKQITVAHVEGTSYIYFANVGCYKLNFSTLQLEAVTLTALDTTAVQGLVAAAGYLVAFTEGAVVWSSTIDVTDFTPSLSTGSSGGNVEQIRGKIVTAVSYFMGAFVYTNANVVVMNSSGNPNYPFQFREVGNSGGVLAQSSVAYEANSTAQYAFTTSGIQAIASTGATTSFPNVSDFIYGLKYETFDAVLQAFSTYTLSAPMKRRIAYIADRYLVISYGVSSLDYAIVYDTVLKRYGKLKITHTCCFELVVFTSANDTEPVKQVAFMSNTGSIRVLSLADAASSDVVAIFGKYQYIRQRHLMLDEVSIESIGPEDNFSLYAGPSLDGKNVPTYYPGYLLHSGEGIRTYGFSAVGINHSILIGGTFDLSSLLLTFHVHGRQ